MDGIIAQVSEGIHMTSLSRWPLQQGFMIGNYIK